MVPGWAEYPQAMMVLGDAGAVQEVAGDYHAEACGFWEPRFFNYSWAGN